MLPLILAAVPASSVPPPPTRLDPLQLFLDADIVVQGVILGLVFASIWVWAIIIAFSTRLRTIDKRNRTFEQKFWRAENVDALITGGGNDTPSRRIAAAGLGEWNRSTEGGVTDRDGVRSRLTTTLDGAVTTESDALADRLTVLATVGSVAPFVGLFGTVWGIMNSFFQIGAQENTSLAVVAPGISEALFATAIGLFAAIPAVIAYNHFSHRLSALEGRLYRFSDRFHASLSRELERL